MVQSDIQSAFEVVYVREGNPREEGTFTMNSLLHVRTTKVSRSLRRERGKRERNALATVPCAEIANEMVQRFGWMQVAECAQGGIFDSIDELLVGLRHGGMNMMVFELTLANGGSKAKRTMDNSKRRHRAPGKPE